MKDKSKKDPLLLGLEAFLLGRDWIVQAAYGKALSVSDFYLVLDELHSPNGFESKVWKNEDAKTTQAERIRKRYESYIKKVKQEFGVDFSFQSKIISSFEKSKDTIFRISKLLLNQICLRYSDESLSIILKNWKPPADFPQFVVCLGYAIQHGFPIEFYYQKQMKFSPENRKMIPYVVTLVEGNLGVIGKDLKDNKNKSFLLSRISGAKTNFLPAYRKVLASGSRPEAFDFQLYSESDPSARFQKKIRTYQIKIAKTNLDLLKHSQTLKLKELEKSDFFVTIEISTYNEWLIFDILFNFGTYAELLSPIDAVERFQKKLAQVMQHYNSRELNSSKIHIIEKKVS